jgi:hypothetical protein
MRVHQMRSTIILIVTLGIMMLAGCSSKGQGMGTLAGHVDIGPLQPVVHVGEPEPTPSPEVYAAWQIVILTENGNREIAIADIDSNGNYQVLLSVGTFMVTAKPLNVKGFSAQQAYPVEILKGKTTQLDIRIDTGIR